MRQIAMFVVATMLAAKAWSADGDYQPLIDRFFVKYEKGKIDDAIDELYSTNKWVAQLADGIGNLKNQLHGLVPLVGSYRGRELIGTASIGGRLVHVTYMVLYDRQPLRMEFVLYRPQDAWTIYAFRFDSNLPEELQAGARAEIASGKN